MAITTAADGSLIYFFHCFSDKIRLDILCESSAWQRIHMKHQALVSSNDKSIKNIKVSSAAILLGALRVNEANTFQLKLSPQRKWLPNHRGVYQKKYGYTF